MRLAPLTFLLAAPAVYAQSTITYSYVNAVLTPPAFTMIVHQDGAGTYQPQGTPAAAITVHDPLRQELFAAAHKDHLFAIACQARARAAYSGDKTLAYSGPDGTGSCTFNNTRDGRLDELAGRLMAVAETIDAGAVLQRDLAHDRLGLDGELQQLIEEQQAGRASEMQNIAPVLKAIAADPRVLNHAQNLAQALLAK